MSIIQICDANLVVQFSKKECLVFNKEGVHVMRGVRTFDCYGIVPNFKFSCKGARLNQVELWHQRLGHASYNELAKVAKREIVVGLLKFGRIENFVGLASWEIILEPLIQRSI